ncbi:hypothetical protein C7S20_16205 [Christiangramia fulva]|uniref:Uncharacterized protein n=1 Tax=Christiangramia fulva TaxID=2126553 RepID=A0A2R3Z8T0_9FLAO|nr:hypothetical protein [Christiangramia fulva]AVR46685.1 hypothetical protein C7S20_16205 [Christiangramia fulva]
MSTNKSKYPQKSGFKVPDNYFEELEDKLMLRITEENSAELPSVNSGFKAPDGYFENLEDRILARQNSKGRLISLFKKENLYYAAAVAAIFVLMWFSPFDRNSATNQITWDDLEIATIEDYIVEGYEMGYIEMDASEFSNYFLENGKLVDDSDFENVSSDAVIDYLEENVDDPSDIIQ